MHFLMRRELYAVRCMMILRLYSAFLRGRAGPVDRYYKLGPGHRLGKIHADIGKLDTPCLFQAIPLFRELRIPPLPESVSGHHWYVSIFWRCSDNG